MLGAFRPQRSFSFNIGDLNSVIGQIVVFEAYYDEIELQKYSYDVTDHYYVSEKRYQNNVIIFFQIWVPPNQYF